MKNEPTYKIGSRVKNFKALVGLKEGMGGLPVCHLQTEAWEKLQTREGYSLQVAGKSLTLHPQMIKERTYNLLGQHLGDVIWQDETRSTNPSTPALVKVHQKEIIKD